MRGTAADSFDGGAFHESLKGGKCSGRLTVLSHALVFESGDKRVAFPLESLEIKSGGAAERLIFFSSAAEPDWRFYTHERSILNHPRLRSSSEVQRQVGAIRRRRLMARTVTFVALAVLGLSVAALFWLKGPLGAFVARRIPASVEEKIGRTAFGQVTGEQRVLDSSAIERGVNNLVDPLVKALPEERYDYRFYVVEDATINAFALPGGTVVINSGLILAAERAEEIQGVLAHEIAHVTEQHAMRNLIEKAGLVVVIDSVFGDMSGLAAVLVNQSAFLLRMEFSRAHEAEADATGLKYLVRANIDPTGMVEFFQRLRRLEGDSLTSSLKWLRTHPATEDRIQRVQNLIDTFPQGGYRRNPTVDLDGLQQNIRQELRSGKK